MTGKEFLNSVALEIKKPTNVSEIRFEKNDGSELEIACPQCLALQGGRGNYKLKIKIK